MVHLGTAERRLKLIKLLCQRRHETIINLSKEFNVSVRTIQRDIDEISDILPIYVKQADTMAECMWLMNSMLTKCICVIMK